MVTEDVESLKVIGVGTVPELDADKVPVVRSGAGTDLNGDGRGVIGQTLKLGVVFRDFGHVEERDDGLVGGFDEQDLEGVPVEGNALQSGEDGVHGGATGNYEKMDQSGQGTKSVRHVPLPIPFMSESEKTLSSCQLTKSRSWLM